MKGGLITIALILVVVASGFFGYYVSNVGRQTQTVTTTVNRTATYTTTTTSIQPCGGQPVWNTNSSSSTFPVLLMQPNSTGYACVTYQTAWKGNPAHVWNWIDLSTPYTFGPLEMSNEVCVPQNGGTACGPDVSDSFITTVYPESVQITGYTDYVTVLYTVTALSNSTGLYSNSVPYEYCTSMPMAVGYAASQLNASDFTRIITPCAIQSIVPVTVSVTGMSVAYLDIS